MVNPKTLENGAVEEIKQELENWFQGFLDEEFKEIVETLAGAFAEAKTDRPSSDDLRQDGA